MQVIQQYLFDSKTHVLNAGVSVDPPCRAEIHLPREIKIEPYLRIVWDEPSVRYLTY